jgi:glyoxylase-like metal-dependent hydrolase (beta-lactamase superfamily II)
VPIQAIATLGHTDSHLAYLVNQTHLLTGDSLLIRGCGRTDFQSGNAEQLYQVVTEVLFALPDETLVYPGHDYRGCLVSTIGEEKRCNPRFVGHDRATFVALMQNLGLPNPQKMAEAVPANQQCGQLVTV